MLYGFPLSTVGQKSNINCFVGFFHFPSIIAESWCLGSPGKNRRALIMRLWQQRSYRSSFRPVWSNQKLALLFPTPPPYQVLLWGISLRLLGLYCLIAKSLWKLPRWKELMNRRLRRTFWQRKKHGVNRDYDYRSVDWI